MVFFSLYDILIVHVLLTSTSVLTTELIVETKKGIVLELIGTYYEKSDLSIFHTVIPINDLCHRSSTLDVCEYVQSNRPEIFEIATITSHSKSLLLPYGKKNISNILQQDIQRLFATHRIDKFVEKSKSIMHFMNDQFYLPGYTERRSSNISDISIADSYQQSFYRINNAASLVLEQIFNNNVGFNFLSDEQITELISVINLTQDMKLDLNNIESSKQFLVNMVLGQTFYALKSCSTTSSDNADANTKCLVVSTIFRRIYMHDRSNYQVYRLIPLPVRLNGSQYIYSNLPKLFGINTLDRKIMLWNNEEIIADCTFSTIIYCREAPITVLLSSLSCLNELLNTELDMQSNTCDVIRSNDNQLGLLNIANNVWYIYSHNILDDCNIDSILSSSIEKKILVHPFIVKLPCYSSIKCESIRIPSMICSNINIVVKPKQYRKKRQDLPSFVSLPEITNRMISIYKSASKLTFTQMQNEMDFDRSFIQKIYQDFGNLLVLVLSYMFSIIVLLMFKIFKRKHIKNHNHITQRLNRLERDLTHV